MRTLFLFLFLCTFCYANIPFHIKQEKVKLPGENMEIGFEGDTNGVQIIVYRVKKPEVFLSGQQNFHKLQIENTDVRKDLNQAINQTTKENKPKVYGEISANTNLNFEFVHYIDKPKFQSAGDDGYSKVSLGINEAGLFLVEVQSSNYVAYTLASNSQLAMIVRRSNKNLIAYVVDRKTGKPYANTEVSIYRNQEFLNKANTSSSGIAYFDTPYFPQVRVMAFSGEHFTIDDPLFFPSIVDVSKCYIFTERPLYLPEEEVHFKGILRRQVADKYDIFTKKVDVAYEAIDAQGHTLLKGNTTCENSAFSAMLKLPESLSLGTCTLKCTIEGKSFQTEFQVEKFQKPKFLASVSSKQKAILMGEKADFEISCRYYAGGEVPEGKVTYELYKNDFEQPLFQNVGLDQFYSENEFRSFKPELIKTGSANLKDGKLSLSFPAQKHTLSYNYQLKVSVYDKQRNRASGSGRIKVEPFPIKFDAKTNKDLFAVEEQIVVQVKAVDINGNGVKTSFTVKALRRDRILLKGGNINIPSEQLKEKLFFETNGTTDERGEATVEIPAALKGAVDIIVKSTENEAQIVKTVWVSEGDEPLLYSGESIFLVADKKTYKIGDVAKVLVLFPTEKASPLISVEGIEIIDYSVVDLKFNNHVVQIPITEQMSPNAYLRIAAIYKNGFIEGETMLVVPPAHKMIHLEISGNKKEYGPGEKAILEISAKDHLGNPIATDLSLAVIDDSIYALANDSNAPLHQFFYPLRRQNVGASSSLNLVSYDYAKVAERLPRPFFKNIVEKAKKVMESENTSSIEPSAEMDAMSSSDNYAMEESADVMVGGDVADGTTATGGGAVFTESEQPQLSRSQPESARKKEDKEPEPVQDKESARQFFKTTALWQAFVQTNSEGKAQAMCDFPDNLSDWKIVARAIDAQTKIGEVTSSISTRKSVMVSVTHPKFLVVKDKANITVSSRNATKENLELSVNLNVSSNLKMDNGEAIVSSVAPNKWLYKQVSLEATQQGSAVLHATTDGKFKDSEIQKINIIPHGILKSYGYAGNISEEVKHSFNIPEGIDLSTAKLVVRILPGFKAAIKDSLGMLMEYPYGCAEQTMSRFMPNLVAAEVFQKMGEKIDSSILKQHVQAGMMRLQQLQNNDGGWGWWQGDSVSHPLLSSYVATGFVQAKNLGYDVPAKVLEKAISFLVNILDNNQLQYHEKSYVAYALTLAKSLPENALDKIFDQQQRLETDAYTLSLLTLACVEQKRTEEARILVEELIAKSKFSGDSLPFWGQTDGYSWSKDAVETTALAIRAMVAANPDNDLIKPALEWLMTQRKDRGWNSTKDTAEVVLTLCHYLNSQSSSTIKDSIVIKINNDIHKANVEDNEIYCEGRELKWTNTLDITTEKSNEYLYYTAYLKYFTNEEPIAATNAGIGVERSYFKLEQVENTTGYNAIPLQGKLSASDLVMVKLEISSGQDHEFVMLEDYLPATAIVVTKDRDISVANTVNSSYTHREFHDEKAVHFFTQLPKGTHTVHYFFRPSISGDFHALPSIASLMYYPEVRGNSAESKIVVE